MGELKARLFNKFGKKLKEVSVDGWCIANDTEPGFLIFLTPKAIKQLQSKHNLFGEIKIPASRLKDCVTECHDRDVERAFLKRHNYK